MRVDAEYRLQTRESSAWTDEYRRQLAKIANDPQRIAQEHSELLKEHCRERLKALRITQGKCNEPRNIILHFGLEEPKDGEKGVTVWIRDGWDEEDKTWFDTSQKIQSRLPRWKALKSLLEHGASLTEAAEIQEQADGILDGRLLLSDPDPVSDLCGRITQLLRDALNKAYKEFETAFQVGMETLRPDENWKQLIPEQRHSLLSGHGLVPKLTAVTGSEQEILASLRAISLGSWADRTAALPTRFDKVRKAAAELMEPETVYVKVNSRALRNPDDIEVWLSELEQTLLEKLKDGPVVVH